MVLSEFLIFFHKWLISKHDDNTRVNGKLL